MQRRSAAVSLSSHLDRANARARAAADHAGVELRDVRDMDDVREAIGVFQPIWGERAQVSSEMAIALAHSDNYVATACRVAEGAVVGTLLGFRGVLDNGETYLHSHILGVLPGAATKGVGYALKLHQRAWALSRGIEMIGWTFDPLVARNAYFNVTKLGADIDSYRQNFYGRMRDAQNGDDDSDRVLAIWRLNSTRAAMAAERPELSTFSPDPSVPAEILSAGPDGEPVMRPADGQTELVSIQIPEDIISMRRDRPDLAARWRRAVRGALRPRLEAGASVARVTRAGRYIVLSGTQSR